MPHDPAHTKAETKAPNANGQTTCPDPDSFIPTEIEKNIPLLPNNKEIVKKRVEVMAVKKRVEVMANMKPGDSFRVPSNITNRFMDLARRKKELANMVFERRSESDLWDRIWKIS